MIQLVNISFEDAVVSFFTALASGGKIKACECGEKLAITHEVQRGLIGEVMGCHTIYKGDNFLSMLSVLSMQNGLCLEAWEMVAKIA